MKKTHKVVMLPTEKASRIMFPTDLDKDYNRLAYLNTATNVEGTHPQHLYIISDDEIKEGDWYIDDTNLVRQSITSDKDYWSRRTDYKKIVATTDKSLHRNAGSDYKRGVGLIGIDEIPESFIQAYIKAYNEGKPITEVDLEMELTDTGKDYGKYAEEYSEYTRIKTRPDNTVICHTSKMYSKDEVIKLLKASQLKRYSLEGAFITETIDKWIQDNL